MIEHSKIMPGMELVINSFLKIHYLELVYTIPEPIPTYSCGIRGIQHVSLPKDNLSTD